MNFLKIKTSWSNLEIGFLKVCVLSMGIIIGVYFYEFLKDYLLVFGTIFIATGIWAFYAWVKKMKQ